MSDNNTITQAEVDKLQHGDALGGGFFTDVIRIGDALHALIIAPAAQGYFKDARLLADSSAHIAGIESLADGMANTKALAAAGSELAAQVLALEINGIGGRAIPARDQVEMQYRVFKPTSEENYCSWRDGENLSSVPPGGLYSEESPQQTIVDAFKEGGSEAFDDGWHWSSTLI